MVKVEIRDGAGQIQPLAKTLATTIMQNHERQETKKQTTKHPRTEISTPSPRTHLPIPPSPQQKAPLNRNN